jgi:plastocyanin
MRIIPLTGAAAFAALSLVLCAQAGSSTHVTIRHQTRGCHAWSVNGSAFRASQSVRVARGASVTFTNNDVMPHTLIKTSGPAITIRHARMAHMSAMATAVFSHAGVYRFKTKAGEDYKNMRGMKTIGEDNELTLVVRVS